MSKFHVCLLTLFPEIFPGPLDCSLAGKALRNKIWSYETINIRDFGLTKHQNVDDEPFGGGTGLVMRPDVLGDALDQALLKYPKAPIYYPSPRGKILNQAGVKQLLREKNIIILCGRFEGIDERIIDEYNIAEISIGDYILSGGEVAALAILDSVIRLIPGVLSNAKTINSESFEEEGEFAGLLEGPLYTRPFEWRGRKAPAILLSGNHAKIAAWQKAQSVSITEKRRPDLIQKNNR